MLYHHGIDLEHVIYGEIEQNRGHPDKYLQKAYQWLEKQTGFYPLFIAVGDTEEDLRMTCYDYNWKTRIGTKWDEQKDRPVGVLRKAGEYPNRVLFSFKDLEGIFMEYQWWSERVMCNNDHSRISKIDKKLVFNPSWSKDRWLRYAKRFPHNVQLVVPKLYLPDAGRIWVRNKTTKKELEQKGFRNVEVRRIKVRKY